MSNPISCQSLAAKSLRGGPDRGGPALSLCTVAGTVAGTLRKPKAWPAGPQILGCSLGLLGHGTTVGAVGRPRARRPAGWQARRHRGCVGLRVGQATNESGCRQSKHGARLAGLSKRGSFVSGQANGMAACWMFGWRERVRIELIGKRKGKRIPLFRPFAVVPAILCPHN